MSGGGLALFDGIEAATHVWRALDGTGKPCVSILDVTYPPEAAKQTEATVARWRRVYAQVERIPRSMAPGYQAGQEESHAAA